MVEMIAMALEHIFMQKKVSVASTYILRVDWNRLCGKGTNAMTRPDCIKIVVAQVYEAGGEIRDCDFFCSLCLESLFAEPKSVLYAFVYS